VYTVTNAALLMSVSWNSGGDLSTAGDIICNQLIYFLTALFSTGSQSLWYLQQQNTRNQRVMCKFIPSPIDRTSTTAMVALMIQVENADAINTITKEMIPVFFKLNSTQNAAKMAGFTIDPNTIQPLAQLSTSNVYNNTAFLCPREKTPSVDSLSCICAAGYQTSGQQCIACQQGQYKSNIGAGNCLTCPLGTMSVSTGASACVTATTGGSGGGGGTNSTINNSNSESSNNNVAIIAGGVIGGFVVVVIAIIVFMYACSNNKHAPSV